jgi:hypothetical protein
MEGALEACRKVRRQSGLESTNTKCLQCIATVLISLQLPHTKVQKGMGVGNTALSANSLCPETREKQRRQDRLLSAGGSLQVMMRCQPEQVQNKDTRFASASISGRAVQNSVGNKSLSGTYCA